MSLDSISTVWSHDGTAAHLVRSLKYARASGVVTTLADRLAPLIPEVDVVTWCPAAPANRRRRGFDQAELLARAVATRQGVPCRRLLARRRGPAQTTRSGVERRLGPDLRRRGRLGTARRVLVVDDVVTTGASVRTAAAVLRTMGASEVHAAAATRAQRHVLGTVGSLGVRSVGTPEYGGTRWTSPSAHGT